MLRSRTGQVTKHDFADERVQHRWVNLRDSEEPLVLTREQVRDALGGRTADTRVEETALVAVELVTNALLHTRSGPTGMAMDVYEDTAVLWVHDGDKNTDAVRLRLLAESPSLDVAENGRGLRLVSALVTTWRVWPMSDGKAVVAEVALLERATVVPAPRNPAP
ncbi:ATP-binding protein [Streptomyces cupreus]|uniref:ATP-binding protein n=1 Tax=Streptomyces cupreus TaxID=2759956 RepID=A0A7X1JBU9_9ACTN|nr:ATP-binding protein [Streptomyces cupreus]MBC2906887.1 ATP-binding protein [Streptomyces cupreus]